MKWWQDKPKDTALPGVHRRWKTVLSSCGLLLAVTLFACGPYFPRWLLSNSDESVQAVPVASFFREIAAWQQGAKSRFKTISPQEAQTPADQVMEADLLELKTALQQAGVKGQPLDARIGACTQLRNQLKDYVEKQAKWQEDPVDWQTGKQVPRPQFKEVAVPAGLPAEFTEYLRGSIAYYAGQSNVAYQAWTALLQRPPAERHYRSTWAEYMLGRMQVEAAPEQAVPHFQKVRELAGAGYADSLGLAAASLGWEARAWLLQKNYRKAIGLYSEQVRAGDSYYAVVSLRRTVAAAFGQSDAAVKTLVEDPVCRRVVTAALISQRGWLTPLINPQLGDATEIWLRLLENSNAVEVELTEQLALAAYQTGKFDLAKRWLKRAPQESATTQWLQAKLLLRAGKVEAAALVLTRLTRQFPALPENKDQGAKNGLLDRIEIIEPEDQMNGPAKARQEMAGELGVLHLGRRDFVAALDCFVRGGFGEDADYVAERVLSVEELKTYVDRNCPAREKKTETPDGYRRPLVSDAMRELLAHRLARANRWPEALQYYLPERQALAGQMQELLVASQKPRMSAGKKAAALWKAAQFMNEHGWDLLVTFGEPDWGGGDYYEAGVSIEERWRQQTNSIVKTSREELMRAAQNEVAPHARGHYRYLAADLAWKAAELMPDQSLETAKVLYAAGGWLKYRDPKAANRFYRALVLRCNKTEFGRLAEKLRWFPPVDDQGRPYMPKRKPKQKNEAPAFVPAVDSLPIL